MMFYEKRWSHCQHFDWVKAGWISQPTAKWTNACVLNRGLKTKNTDVRLPLTHLLHVSALNRNNVQKCFNLATDVQSWDMNKFFRKLNHL